MEYTWVKLFKLKMYALNSLPYQSPFPIFLYFFLKKFLTASSINLYLFNTIILVN
jgi:hypothetical protein